VGERVAEPPAPRGAAIECRINAEDAAHDFRPATGRVINLNLPAGPSVRIDTHLGVGAEVSPYYDSLIAKLICYGADREQARTRIVAALGEFALLGIKNTAAFLRDVVASPAFARADLSTRFLEENFPSWANADGDLTAALITAALVADGVLGAARGPAAANGARDQAGGADLRTPWTELAGFELWGRR